ncbi:MAG: hypothetical protein ABSE70_11260, partial [Candidatus Limnocylindrales bacterium]
MTAGGRGDVGERDDPGGGDGDAGDSLEELLGRAEPAQPRRLGELIERLGAHDRPRIAGLAENAVPPASSRVG